MNNTARQEEVYYESFPLAAEAISEASEACEPEARVKRHFFSRILIHVLLFAARKLSWRIAYQVGTLIGLALYYLRIRRRVALINLDIVFAQAKSLREKKRIYKESLINLGHVVINHLRLPYMDKTFWSKHCEVVNEHILKDAYNRNNGVLLLAGHLGMMDLAGGFIGMRGYPIGVVGKRFKNLAFDEYVIKSRRAMNLASIPNRGSMPRIMADLRRGAGVAMAIDQNMKSSVGIFVNWMGRPASSVRSAAYVVKETGASAITGYCTQVSPDKFKLIFTEEVLWEPHPEEPEKELLLNTQKQADALQRIIYERPELWFWIHKRWKNQPEGCANPYK